MPQDSLLLQHFTDSLRVQDLLNQPGPLAVLNKNAMTGGISFLVFIIVFIGIIALPFLINKLWEKHLQQKIFKTAQLHFTEYDASLAMHNAYYKSLPGDMRKRFLERVAWFITTKTFTCIDLKLDEKMPLLISAASIQITFGLDKYLLDFFDTIYIMQHNYTYGLYNMPFEGHVNSNGIYLSWDNFLRGYENYNDADNVGIHEMAHALAYVNFMAGANNGQDDAFIKRFYHFSSVARPIFNDMQNGKTNLLNAYAATNYNEFWAVAVETFFEQSIQMKAEMPGLYSAMCMLLSQDPSSPDKLLTNH